MNRHQATLVLVLTFALAVSCLPKTRNHHSGLHRPLMNKLRDQIPTANDPAYFYNNQVHL